MQRIPAEAGVRCGGTSPKRCSTHREQQARADSATITARCVSTSSLAWWERPVPGHGTPGARLRRAKSPGLPFEATWIAGGGAASEPEHPTGQDGPSPPVKPPAPAAHRTRPNDLDNAAAFNCVDTSDGDPHVAVPPEPPDWVPVGRATPDAAVEELATPCSRSHHGRLEPTPNPTHRTRHGRLEPTPNPTHRIDKRTDKQGSEKTFDHDRHYRLKIAEPGTSSTPRFTPTGPRSEARTRTRRGEAPGRRPTMRAADPCPWRRCRST